MILLHLLVQHLNLKEHAKRKILKIQVAICLGIDIGEMPIEQTEISVDQ